MPAPPGSHRLRSALAEYCSASMRQNDWQACVAVLRGCALAGHDFRVLPYQQLIPFLAQHGQWGAIREAQQALMPLPYRLPDPARGQTEKKETSASLSAPAAARRDGELLSLLSRNSETERAGDHEEGEGRGRSLAASERKDEEVGEEDLFPSTRRRQRKVKVGRAKGSARDDDAAQNSGSPHEAEATAEETQPFTKAEAGSLVSVLLIAATRDNAEDEAECVRSVLALAKLATAHHLQLSDAALKGIVDRVKDWMARGVCVDDAAVLTALWDVSATELAARRRTHREEPPPPEPVAQTAAAVATDGGGGRPPPKEAGDSSVVGAVVEKLTALLGRARGTSVLASKAYARTVARLDSATRQAVRSDDGCAHLLHSSADPALPLASRELMLRLSVLHALAAGSSGAAKATLTVESKLRLALRYAELSRDLTIPKRQRQRQRRRRRGEDSLLSPMGLLPLPEGMANGNATSGNADGKGADLVPTSESSALAVMVLSDAIVASPPRHADASSSLATLVTCVKGLLRVTPVSFPDGCARNEAVRVVVEKAACACALLLDQDPSLIHLLVPATARARQGGSGGGRRAQLRFVLDVLNRCAKPAAVAEQRGRPPSPPAVRSGGNKAPKGKDGDKEEEETARAVAATSGRRRARLVAGTASATEPSDLARGTAELLAFVSPLLAGLAREREAAAAEEKEEEERFNKTARARDDGDGGTSSGSPVVGGDVAEVEEEDSEFTSFFSQQLLGEANKAAGAAVAAAGAAGLAKRHREAHGGGRDAHEADAAFFSSILSHTAHPTDFAVSVGALLIPDVKCVRGFVACLPATVAAAVADKLVREVSSTTPKDPAQRDAAVEVACLLITRVLRERAASLERKADLITEFFASPLHTSSPLAPDIPVRLFASDPDVFSELHAQAMALDGALRFGAEESLTARDKWGVRTFRTSSSALDRLISELIHEDSGTERGKAVVPSWRAALRLLRAAARRSGSGGGGGGYGALSHPSFPSPSAPPSLTSVVGGAAESSLSVDSPLGYPLSPEESFVLKDTLGRLARRRAGRSGPGGAAGHPVKEAVALFYAYERQNKRLSMREVEFFTWAVRRGPLPFARHVLQYCDGHTSNAIAVALVDCAVSAFYRGLSRDKEEEEGARGGQREPRLLLAERKAFITHQCEQVLVGAMRLLSRNANRRSPTDAHGEGDALKEDDDAAARFDSRKAAPMTPEEVRRLASKVRRLYYYPHHTTAEDANYAFLNVRDDDNGIKNGVAATASLYRVLRDGGLYDVPAARHARVSLQHSLDVCALTNDAPSAREAFDTFVQTCGPEAVCSLPRSTLLSLIKLELESLADGPAPAAQPGEGCAPSKEVDDDIQVSWPTHGRARTNAASASMSKRRESHPQRQAEQQNRYLLRLVEAGLANSHLTSTCFSFTTQLLPLCFGLGASDGNSGQGLIPVFIGDAQWVGPAKTTTTTTTVSLLEMCLAWAKFAAWEEVSTAADAADTVPSPPPRQLAFFLGVVRALLLSPSMGDADGLHAFLVHLERSGRYRARCTARDTASLSHWFYTLKQCTSRKANKRNVSEGEANSNSSTPSASGLALEGLMRRLTTPKVSESLPTSEKLAIIAFLSRFVSVRSHHGEGGAGDFCPVLRASTVELAVAIARRAFEEKQGHLVGPSFASRSAMLSSLPPPPPSASPAILPCENLQCISVLSSLFPAFLVHHRRLTTWLELCGKGHASLANARFRLNGALTDELYRVNGAYLDCLDMVSEAWSRDLEPLLLSGPPLDAREGLRPFLVSFLSLTFYGASSFTMPSPAAATADTAAAAVVAASTPSQCRVHRALWRIAQQLQRVVLLTRDRGLPGGRVMAAAAAEVVATDLLVLALGGKEWGASLPSDTCASSGAFVERARRTVAQFGGTGPPGTSLVQAMLPLWFHVFPTDSSSSTSLRDAVRLVSLLLGPEGRSAEIQDSDSPLELAEGDGDDDADEAVLLNWRAHVGTADATNTNTAMDLLEDETSATHVTDDSAVDCFDSSAAALFADVLMVAVSHAPHLPTFLAHCQTENVTRDICLPLLEHKAQHSVLFASSSATADAAGDPLLLSSFFDASQDYAVLAFLSATAVGGATTSGAVAWREPMLKEMVEELSLAAPHRSDLAVVLLVHTPFPPASAHDTHVGWQTLADRVQLVLHNFAPCPEEKGKRSDLRRVLSLASQMTAGGQNSATPAALSILSSLFPLASTEGENEATRGGGGGANGDARPRYSSLLAQEAAQDSTREGGAQGAAAGHGQGGQHRLRYSFPDTYFTIAAHEGQATTSHIQKAPPPPQAARFASFFAKGGGGEGSLAAASTAASAVHFTAMINESHNFPREQGRLLWQLAFAPTMSAMVEALWPPGPTRHADGHFRQLVWTLLLLRTAELEESSRWGQHRSSSNSGSEHCAKEQREVYGAALRLFSAWEEEGTLTNDDDSSSQLMTEVVAFACCATPTAALSTDASTVVDTVLAACVEDADAKARLTNALWTGESKGFLEAVCGALRRDEVTAELCDRFILSPWPPARLQRSTLPADRITADALLSVKRWNPTVLASLAGPSSSGSTSQREVLLVTRHVSRMVRQNEQGLGLFLVIDRIVRQLFYTHASDKSSSYFTALRVLIDEVVAAATAPDGARREFVYLPHAGMWRLYLPLLVERNGLYRRDTAVSEHVEAMHDLLASAVAADMDFMNRAALSTEARFQRSTPFTKRDSQSILGFFLRALSHARTFANPLGWHDNRQATLDACWTALLGVARLMSTADLGVFPRTVKGEESNLWSPELHQILLETFTFPVMEEEAEEEVEEGLGLIMRSHQQQRQQRQKRNMGLHERVFMRLLAKCSTAPAEQPQHQQQTPRISTTSPLHHRLTATQLLRFLCGEWKERGGGSSEEASPSMDRLLSDALERATRAGAGHRRDNVSAHFADVQRRLLASGEMPSHEGWQAAMRRAVDRHTPAATLAGRHLFLLFAPYMRVTTAVMDCAAVLVLRSARGVGQQHSRSAFGLGVLLRREMQIPLGPVGVAALAELYASGPITTATTADGPLSVRHELLLHWRIVQTLAQQSEAQLFLAMAALDKTKRASTLECLERGCVEFLVCWPHHHMSYDTAFLAVGERLHRAANVVGAATFLQRVAERFVEFAEAHAGEGRRAAGMPRARAMHLYQLWKAEQAVSRGAVGADPAFEVCFLDAMNKCYAVPPVVKAVPDTDRVPLPYKSTPASPSPLWRQALQALATLKGRERTVPLAPAAEQAVCAVTAQSLRDLCAARPAGKWEAAMALAVSLQDKNAAAATTGPAPAFLYATLQYLNECCDFASVPPSALVDFLTKLARQESSLPHHGEATRSPLSSGARRNRLAALTTFAKRLALHPALSLEAATASASALALAASSLSRPEHMDGSSLPPSPPPPPAAAKPEAAASPPSCWHAFCDAVVMAFYRRGQYKDVLRFAVGVGFSHDDHPPATARQRATRSHRVMREAVFHAAPRAVPQVLQLLEAAGKDRASSTSGRRERVRQLETWMSQGDDDGEVHEEGRQRAPLPSNRASAGSVTRDIEECLRNNRTDEAARLVQEHPFLLSCWRGDGEGDPQRRGTESAAHSGKSLLVILRGIARRGRFNVITRFALACHDDGASRPRPSSAFPREPVSVASPSPWTLASPPVLTLLLQSLSHTASSDASMSTTEAVSCAAQLSAALLGKLVGEKTVQAADEAEVCSVLAETWTWMALALAPSHRGRSPLALFVAAYANVEQGERAATLARNDALLRPLLSAIAHRRDTSLTAAPLPPVILPSLLLLVVQCGSAHREPLSLLRSLLHARSIGSSPGGGDGGATFLYELLGEMEAAALDAAQHGSTAVKAALLLLQPPESREHASGVAAARADRRMAVAQWRDSHFLRSPVSGAAGAARDLAYLLYAAKALPHFFFGFTLAHLRKLFSLLASAAAAPPGHECHELFFTVAHAALAAVEADRETGVLAFTLPVVIDETVSATVKLLDRQFTDPPQTPDELACAWRLVESANHTAKELVRVAASEEKLTSSASSLATVATSVLALLTNTTCGRDASPFAVVDAVRDRRFADTVPLPKLVPLLTQSVRRTIDLLRACLAFPESAVAEHAAVRRAREHAGEIAEQTWRGALSWMEACAVARPLVSVPQSAASTLADALLTCATFGCPSSSAALANVEAVLGSLRRLTGLLHLSRESRALVKMACIDACGPSWQDTYGGLTAYRPSHLLPTTTTTQRAAAATSQEEVGAADEERLLRAIALARDAGTASALLDKARQGLPNGRFSLRVHSALFDVLTTSGAGSPPRHHQREEEKWQALEHWFRGLLEDAQVPTAGMLERMVDFLQPTTTPHSEKREALGNVVRLMKMLTLLPPVTNRRHKGEGNATGRSVAVAPYTLSSAAVDGLFQAAAFLAERGDGDRVSRTEAREAVADFVSWLGEWSRPPPLSTASVDTAVRYLCRPRRGGTVAQLLAEAFPMAKAGGGFVDERAMVRGLLPAKEGVLAALSLTCRQHTLHGRLACSPDALCEVYAAACAVAAGPCFAKDSSDAVASDGFGSLMTRIAQDGSAVSPRLRAVLALATSEQTLWFDDSTGGTTGSAYFAPATAASRDATTPPVAVPAEALTTRLEAAYVAALSAFLPADAAVVSETLLQVGDSLHASHGADGRGQAEGEAGLVLLRDILTEEEGPPSSLDVSLPYRTLLKRRVASLSSLAAEQTTEAEALLSDCIAWLQGGVMAGIRSGAVAATPAHATTTTTTTIDSSTVTSSPSVPPAAEVIATHAVADVFLLGYVVRSIHARMSTTNTALSPSSASPRASPLRRSREQARRLLLAVASGGPEESAGARNHGQLVHLVIASIMSH